MDEMELNTLIEKMPIGTPVRYFSNYNDHSQYVDTVTRSLPWISESGQVVVMIKGKSGYVAVCHIRLLPTVDPLLADAKNIVLQIGEVRVGRIQRELRIGYTRAARLIDLMCDDGFLMRNEEGVPILVTITDKGKTHGTPHGEMDDSQLPEWYQMLKEVFGELKVFSHEFYENMNCANVLLQVRYAAMREKAVRDE